MFGIVKVDFYQHCKHHSTFASTKTVHFLIFLIRRAIRSIWMKAIWPSSVDIDDVKELLSDRILTLTWKTWWSAVECVPTQLWKKLLPSFCALYFLCYYSHTCFFLQEILNTKCFQIILMVLNTNKWADHWTYKSISICFSVYYVVFSLSAIVHYNQTGDFLWNQTSETKNCVLAGLHRTIHHIIGFKINAHLSCNQSINQSMQSEELLAEDAFTVMRRQLHHVHVKFSQD